MREPDPLLHEWEAALDELEGNLRFSGEAGELPRTWSAPKHLGRMPAELVERARNLVRDQQQALEQLEELKISTGRHLAALRTVPSPTWSPNSVYLDVSG